MRNFILLFLFLTASCSFSQTDSAFIRQLYDEALENGQAHQNLKVLCKSIGARISGSKQAEDAIRWGKHLLESYHFDTVYLQKIEVPFWNRGKAEKAWVTNTKGEKINLNITALGGSGSTHGILTGDVIIVKNMDELKTLKKEDVKDNIIFLNEAFDEKYINTFEAYGRCFPIRGDAPNEASKLGAKAVIIRSLASPTDHFPHTGVTFFEDSVKVIPCAAMSTQNANDLTALIKIGKVSISMDMNCEPAVMVPSYNVIAEIKGIDDAIITIGGHLDSWDLGEGAHDDGAGIVHSIEALRILKKLNYKPNHTIRCVLFMNEENGNFGGKNYSKLAKENNEKHILAIESDAGGFLPMGFSISGNNAQIDFVRQFQNELKPYNLFKLNAGHSGVDISPLKKDYPEMLQLGLEINSQAYFNYHHSAADVFETVNKRELELGAAAIATMVYLLDKSLK